MKVACALLAFSAFAHAQQATFITLGPQLMLTTDSVSAPSPVSPSLGIGRTFLLSENIALEAHSSFFTQYYLFDDEKAKPAEVENRTALVLCALPTLNPVWICYKDEKQWLEIGGGLGFLARYGLKANGVKDEGDDVKEINRYFWRDLNYFYPDIAFSYNRVLASVVLGADFRVYIPVAALSSGNGFEEGIFSLSLKIGKQK